MWQRARVPYAGGGALLKGILSEDRRNTLITELAGRTNDTVSHYQSLNDADLAGCRQAVSRKVPARSDAEPRERKFEA